jgi:hypothetical protein
MDGLQTTVTDLRNVDVGAEGITAVQTHLATVGADVQHVADDAKAQYATHVDQLKTDCSGVQSAVATVQTSPTAATLSAVKTSISTLADGARGFADDVAATC